MKNCIATFILLCLSVAAHALPYSEEVDRIFFSLDSLIDQRDYFRIEKEKRILMLKDQLKGKTSPEERFFANKQCYEEYYVYNSDSAMVYVNENLRIAKELGRKDWVADWTIRKSFMLSVTGMLTEAFQVIQTVDTEALTKNLKVDYYTQMVYLFSHYGQYLGDDEGDLRRFYLQQEQLYNDSLMLATTIDHPAYLWNRWGKYRGTNKVAEIVGEMKLAVDNSALDSRQSAMNAYALSQLYRDMGDTENYLKYIAYSSMADIRSCNKDIASLEELGRYLFEQGDIDRAYTYINYCFRNAQAYKDRVRIMGISSILDQIRDVYQKRNKQQESRLHSYLILVSILSVILLAALIYIYNQMRDLKYSRAKLSEFNHQLNSHVKDLSETHRRLEEANNKLVSLNLQLQDSNDLLKESNYVKEEYIGYVFSICSNYINKLDEYRKTINRKIKANQIDDVKKLTDTPTMAQSELKEFYRNFDVIFLHVYPDFVSDFNALLRPEEQIVLKEGELLNTELRIYALVRLGINDSVKIAEFLHCSPQTVYNNRLKIRNKALIPKEVFADTVRSLGKMQQ